MGREKDKIHWGLPLEGVAKVVSNNLLSHRVTEPAEKKTSTPPMAIAPVASVWARWLNTFNWPLPLDTVAQLYQIFVVKRVDAKDRI